MAEPGTMSIEVEATPFIDAVRDLRAAIGERDQGIERRFFRSEVRAIGDADGRKIAGYAAVFDQMSEDMGGWRETIRPEAFTDVLSDDVRALFNHDPNLILGRTMSDTLDLAQDRKGLRYEITLPDTQYARDLIVSVERGDIDQSSIGFRVLEESWQNPTEERPYPVRVIHSFAELYDVSPVTFPAFVTTTVAVRDMASKMASDSRATADADNETDQRAAGRLALKRHKLELLDL